MCPCQYGRVGAFLLTFAIYWAWVLGGLPVMFAQLQAGNIIAIAWAVAALLGVGNLLIGVREALAHDDDFELSRAVWSFGVIGICSWALWRGWFIRSNWFWFNVSRCGWLAWEAAEWFSLWVQFRGPRRRHNAPPAAAPLSQRSLRRVRSKDGEWSEATEWYGNNHPYQPREKFFPTPPQISQNGAALQIVWLPDERGQLIAYAPDGNGNFVPVQLPEQTPRLR
jgi:hypothetical protein